MTSQASPDVQTRRIVVAWLSNLARVTRHRQGKLSDEDLAAVKDERAIYAEMLARDFPSGAFSVDSLHAAAQGHAFFPAYEEIRARVQEWWNVNRPASAPRLTGPDAAHLSDMDARWLTFYRQRRAELLDQPGSINWPDEHREPVRYAGTDLGRLDSLVRRQSPAAWEVIAGPKPKQEPVDVERVRAAVASIVNPS